jgi:hypothetical protein
MLTEYDWAMIYKAIESRVQPSEIVYGEVIRRDIKHRLVWIDEFGDQPIPLVGFNYNVPVLDVEPLGSIVDPDLDIQMIPRQRAFSGNVIVPQIGEVVLVLRQFGRNRLPHCIGTALSTVNYSPDDV